MEDGRKSSLSFHPAALPKPLVPSGCASIGIIAAPLSKSLQPIADEGVLLDGDVLFQGSIGRTDLPGGDYATLLDSIARLLHALPDDTRLLPGHMGETTLGRERATNPFLHELTT